VVSRRNKLRDYEPVGILLIISLNSIISASAKFFGEEISPEIGFNRDFIIIFHRLIISRMYQ